MGFKQRPAQFIIETDHFVEELRVLDVVALLVAIVRQGTSYHLLVRDVLEVEEVALVLI